jgi:hypothetical protein
VLYSKLSLKARSESWGYVLICGLEMRKEYDFSNVRPNKYAKKYVKGTNIVVIEPDLVKFFPDSESVNAALRALVSIISKTEQRRKPKKVRRQRMTRVSEL